MKYRLKVGEETAELDVSALDHPKRVRITMAEKEYHVTCEAVSENEIFLVVNGKATKAFVARGDEGKYLFIEGRCFLVQDADRIALRRPRHAGPIEAPREVTPPMPSVVVRILVSEGDRVKRGQGLVVLTAMKMETTLVAPFDGWVKKINTSINQKVAPGDILVEIQEEGPEHE